jgi:membrane protease YdiL (CAAX protease family)
MVILANRAVGRRWAHHVIALLAGFTAGVTFLIGALDLGGAGVFPTALVGPNRLPLDISVMATAVVAAVLASKPVRERVARIMPIDPDNPVHAFALVLAVLLFGIQLTTFFFLNSPAADQPQTPAPGIGDLIASDLSLLILAAAGVGIFMRRNLPGTASRLGLVRPAWWHVVLAIGAAGVFFAFVQAMDALSHAWTPGVARQVDSNVQHLFGGLDNPLGIVILALVPGLCEEVLFRGALQPRLGLIAPALLFTSLHTQYGLSLVLLAVLVIAIGLGLIRKFTSTTTSSICHITYNLLSGIGIAGSLMTGAAIGIEALLIGVSVYAVWKHWRRATPPGEVLTPRVGSAEINE